MADDFAENGISFDPKTWVGASPVIETIRPVTPAGTVPTTANHRALLSAGLAALLLAGAAAAAYLTRTPAVVTLPARVVR